MSFRHTMIDLARPGDRPRLDAPDWPAVVYAIGDIHGCLGPLEVLHAKIMADAARYDGEKLIVCLGDYIDRGPRSAEVIAFLQRDLPHDFTRICLAGNHEAMLLDFLAEPRLDGPWLQNGGLTTLASYGINLDQSARGYAEDLRRQMPDRHLTFLRALPLTLTLPGICFVHAGLEPYVPIAEQNERDLLWIRQGGGEGLSAFVRLVVHGHTPAAEPVVTPTRICLDTAIGSTGILTAARLVNGQPPFILNTRA